MLSMNARLDSMLFLVPLVLDEVDTGIYLGSPFHFPAGARGLNQGLEPQTAMNTRRSTEKEVRQWHLRTRP